MQARAIEWIVCTDTVVVRVKTLGAWRCAWGLADPTPMPPAKLICPNAMDLEPSTIGNLQYQYSTCDKLGELLGSGIPFGMMRLQGASTPGALQMDDHETLTSYLHRRFFVIDRSDHSEPLLAPLRRDRGMIWETVLERQPNRLRDALCAC